MRRARLTLACAAALAGAVGCAAPFAEVEPSAPVAGVALVYCGSAGMSTKSVMAAMEPPTGQAGGEDSVPAPKVLTVCLRLQNQGGEVARVDRSAIELHCPHERDDAESDSDDQEVIAHPGESKELHVSFHYSPLPSGEDVTLGFEHAVTVGGKPVKLRPLALRKK